ncbi:hypothetical protein TNCV_1734931 [Trichonephila clavipes]|nr:hypothetical protein TNCV_1734931 [Trichonephila clavipes]
MARSGRVSVVSYPFANCLPAECPPPCGAWAPRWLSTAALRGLYRPSKVYDKLQGIHSSQKIIGGGRSWSASIDHDDLKKAQCPPVGGLWKFGEEVPAQMSSPSLASSSNFRRSKPIAFTMLQCDHWRS